MTGIDTEKNALSTCGLSKITTMSGSYLSIFFLYSSLNFGVDFMIVPFACEQYLCINKKEESPSTSSSKKISGFCAFFSNSLIFSIVEVIVIT